MQEFAFTTHDDVGYFSGADGLGARCSIRHMVRKVGAKIEDYFCVTADNISLEKVGKQKRELI